MAKTYRCPYCGVKIRKGENICKSCEKPISWIPVTNDSSNVNTIISRGKTSITSKSGIEQLYQKLFLQMYNIVKKYWKVSMSSNGEYVASLDILVGEPQNIPEKSVKPSVSKQPIKPIEKIPVPKIQPMPQSNEQSSIPLNEYDRIVQEHRKNLGNASVKNSPTPEFLEFQRRFKQETMNVPQMNQTNDGFNMNMF